VAIYQNRSDKSASLHKWSNEFMDRKPLKFKQYGSRKIPNQTKEKEFRAASRKSVLYENCKMLSPQGEILCVISNKKAKWYIDKQLADSISVNPLIIKLKFQPNGKGHSEDNYYLSPKENKCVVCGEVSDFMRHSIVPHSYRKYFDLKYKSRSSHDIVLLCRKCTEKVGIEDLKMKRILAFETNISLKGEGPPFIVDENVTRIRSKATTLLKATNIPEKRKQEIRKDLQIYKKKDFLTEDDIIELSNLQAKIKNPHHKCHEELLVESLKTQEQVEKFVKRWRYHFLDSMNPRFLPNHWSPDRSIDII